MTTRAIWKGVLRLGKESLPVGLYSAVTDSTVRFHLLHDADSVRVEQRMVNPETGETKQGDDLHKGFEVEPGTFVLLSKKELSALEPPSSRDIAVSSFVPGTAIGPEWYDRPYYLGPDGAAATERYFALVEALREKERVGIVHWVMRNRRYSGALRGEGDHLLLVTLRTLDSVVQAPKARGNGKSSEAKNGSETREQKMAEQLVSALEGPFDPARYEDEHRKRVLAIIDAKAKGKRIRAPKTKPVRASSSLAGALAASLKRVQGSAHRKERKSA